jgi:hypothetical protein
MKKLKLKSKLIQKMIGKECDSNQFMLIWLVLIFVHFLYKKIKINEKR